MIPRVTAIVPAAGRGTRFGAAGNKVFQPLLGRPILRWSLEALCAAPEIGALVIVASEGEQDAVRAIAAGLSTPWTIATGGAARQDSVRNALERVETPVVAVHDAARPLVAPDTVQRAIASARAHGSGVAAIPVADTLKRQDNGVVLETVDRSTLWATQTPQCAATHLLRAAYVRADHDGFQATDEAGLLEYAGLPVHLSLGSPRNLKVTTPDDLAVAEAILRARPERNAMTLPRIGYGYDVHRFAPGRPMVLGGVRFPVDYGLLGHSDADALLHAVMDALLGAAGLPDIGHLFPNTDERWRGASSMDLLAIVMDRIRAGGWLVGNVDISVIAERPKMGPHVPEMRANIARVLGVEEGAVGIKATTAEGLGDLGNGEGLAAHAVCLLGPA